MKNRIKELMKQKKMSRDQLADILDVHPVTISKIISGKIGMSAEKIERFAKAFNVPPEAIISQEPLIPMRTVKVVAYVQAGAWAESNDLLEEDQYSIAVPEAPELARYSLTGVQVRGPSMNLRYPEGTILVITNAIETQEEIQPGKRYVVKRESADGMFEYTVKTLHRDEVGDYWLVPESSDPRFSQPIRVNGEMNDTISIMGRVVYSILKE